MANVTLIATRKEFDSTVAVDNLTLRISDGEFVSFLGPSGCGKTTTLRMIAGFIEPTSGRIELGGQVVTDTAARVFVPPEHRRLGMVFQSYAVWPHMNVFDNIAYPLKVARTGRAQTRAAVERVADLVKLDQLLGRYPNQLSGGQQQRVALARALVAEPRVLLLDEPLSNLDARLRDEMRVEIKELQRRTGITIVFVTHDQVEAMVLSDRIAVMNAGRVHQVGPPREIYEQPADRFVAQFVGEANLVSVAGNANPPHVADDPEFTVPVEPGTEDAVIRPEDLCVRDTAEAGAVMATAEISFYQGDRVFCHLRRLGRKLIAALPRERFPERGQTLYVSITKAAALPVSQEYRHAPERGA